MLSGIWERMVKDGIGKGWRGKVEGMKMLLVLRGEMGSGLPLKPWLGTLVDLLEDSDGNVRDQAREVGPSAMIQVVRLLTDSDGDSSIVTGLDTSCRAVGAEEASLGSKRTKDYCGRDHRSDIQYQWDCCNFDKRCGHYKCRGGRSQ